RASDQPMSAVEASKSVARISASAGLSREECSPHSSADEGTSRRGARARREASPGMEVLPRANSAATDAKPSWLPVGGPARAPLGRRSSGAWCGEGRLSAFCYCSGQRRVPVADRVRHGGAEPKETDDDFVAPFVRA